MENSFKMVFGVVQMIPSKPSDLRKFFKFSVSRGKTVWPKTAANLLHYVVRWDYGGIATFENKECNKDGVVTHGNQGMPQFQLQPNAGKIHSTIKQWRDKNGGTHAVIGVMYVPDVTDPEENDS